MNVYLVQHGAARSKDEDPQRTLTERGRDETAVVAKALARLGLRPRGIWHSGKERASQTAEILGDRLAPAEGVSQRDDLAPMDYPASIANAIEELTESVIVVGHLPHLDRLAALLLAGDPDRGTIEFRNSAAVCLSREDDRWLVCWILTPEIAAALTQ